MRNLFSNKSIENLYFGFFIFLPFIFSPSILDPFFLPRSLFTICFLTTVMLIVLFKKETNFSVLNNNYGIKLLCFYLLGALISLNKSLIISESHAALSRQVLIIVFFICTVFLLSQKIIRQEKIIQFVDCFGKIAIGISLLAILNKTINGQHLLQQVDSLSGTFANKNLLSSILFLCLPFFFIGMNSSKKSKIISIITIIFTVAIILLLRTRTVLLALFVFFSLLIYFQLKNKSLFTINKRIIKTLISLIVISIITVVYLFVNNQNFSFKNSIYKTYFQRILNSDTLLSRSLYWENSFLMFKENWLFGVGPGNWQIFFPNYGLNNFTRQEVINGLESVQNPHNDFIWTLCETGIIGFLCYFGFVFFTLYQAIWLVKNVVDPIEKKKYYYLFSGIIGYLVISFFDFPSSRIEHQVVFMVILAIINYCYYKEKEINYNSTSKYYWSILLFFGLGYSLLVTLKRFNSESHVLRLSDAKNDWDTVINEATQATNYFYGIDSKSFPMEWYQGMSYLNKNDTLKSMQLFEQAYSKNPFNIVVINNYAGLLALTNDRKKAIVYYKKALEISTNYEDARLNLAACYYKENEFENAFLVIDKCNFNSTNLNYRIIFEPILRKKLKLIIKHLNDKKATFYVNKQLQHKENILQLYQLYKNKNITFDKFVKEMSYKSS